MTLLYIRTCQSCGKRHLSKRPEEYRDDHWRDMKCRRCGSRDLDYGSERDVDSTTLRDLPRVDEEEDFS